MSAFLKSACLRVVYIKETKKTKNFVLRPARNGLLRFALTDWLGGRHHPSVACGVSPRIQTTNG
jgi:hypothetical protein